MFELVVRAIIKDKEGRILLTRRVKQPEKGKWCLPGGKVEPLEKVEQAVRREVSEELSLDFFPRFLFYSQNIFRHNNLHTIIFFFSGHWEGDLKIKTDEISDAKYWSYEDIERTKEIAWDHKQMLLTHESVWK